MLHKSASIRRNGVGSDRKRADSNKNTDGPTQNCSPPLTEGTTALNTNFQNQRHWLSCWLRFVLLYFFLLLLKKLRFSSAIPQQKQTSHCRMLLCWLAKRDHTAIKRNRRSFNRRGRFRSYTIQKARGSSLSFGRSGELE